MTTSVAARPERARGALLPRALFCFGWDGKSSTAALFFVCLVASRALLADLPVVPTPRPTARPTTAIPATPTPGVIPTWTPPVPTSTTVAATPTATTATPVPTATAPTFTPAASPTPTTAPTPSGPWVAMGNGWQSTRVTASG